MTFQKRYFFLTIMRGLLILLISADAVGQRHAGKEALQHYMEKVKPYVSAGDENTFREKLSGQEATADLQILMEAMQEAQSGVQRYTSPRKIRTAYREGLRGCRDSLHYLDFSKSVAALISASGCSHTGWNHAKGYYGYRKDKATFFPFDIVVTNDRMYILHNNAVNTNIQEGSRLVAINGTPVSRIAKRLARYVQHEGTNRTHIDREMEDYFPYLYSGFIGNPASFTIELVPPGTRKHIHLTVPAQTLEASEKIRGQRYPAANKKDLPLRFRYNDTLSTGVYTIDWFNADHLKENGQDFIAFTDSMFKELDDRKAKNLIIDVRDNGGGFTAYSRQLFEYFIDDPYPYFETVEVGKTDNYFFQPLMTGNGPYNDSMLFSGMENGVRRWINNPNLRAVPAKKNRFHNNIYILTNGNTMSASVVWASSMRLRTKAIVIGEETGGAVGGPNAMIISFKLPYSQIAVHLSTAVYTMPGYPKRGSRGLIPDLSVQRTIEDILAGRDTVLEMAFSQIRKRSFVNK